MTLSKDIEHGGFPTSESKTLSPSGLKSARKRARPSAYRSARKPRATPSAQNALHQDTSEVYSESETSVNPGVAAEPSLSQEKTMEIVKQAVQPTKSNAFVYNIPGLRGTIRIARKLLAGDAPDRFSIGGVTFAEPKAARASKVMTPEQVVAEQKKIADAEAKLAKRKARLAPTA